MRPKQKLQEGTPRTKRGNTVTRHLLGTPSGTCNAEDWLTRERAHPTLQHSGSTSTGPARSIRACTDAITTPSIVLVSGVGGVASALLAQGCTVPRSLGGSAWPAWDLAAAISSYERRGKDRDLRI